ncbi:MAG: fasciclin domain-containing protein [Pseudomonadota bacterium]
MNLLSNTSLAALLLGATTLAACEAADDTLPADAAPAEVAEAVAEEPPAAEAVAEEAASAGEEMMDEAEDMAEDAADAVTGEADAPGTIVEVAVGTEDLSTLVAAVTAAGLVDTLNSEGPFTVFAPPNSAFEKLPEGTVETLVQPDQKETLTGILTYHVVAGEVKAADLVAAITGEEDGTLEITTVNGATLTASIVDGAPVLTDAAGNTSNIIATDVDASNGVVHLIDTVVMPG